MNVMVAEASQYANAGAKALSLSFKTWDRALKARHSTASTTTGTMSPETADGSPRNSKRKRAAKGNSKMPCDRSLKKNQTISERAAEVRQATERLAAALAAGRVRVKIGPQGAIAFEGWDANSRDGITDACAVRRLLATGNAMARLAIARAEQLAGRKLDMKTVASGLHTHDGVNWHRH
jgi:hypothetical protein